jgi:DNA-binding PadR family transcriptional regulator
MAELMPTRTSYAVLGLLALRPWTTYELARQTERSLRWFFPRAERAVYLEAKRLVRLGWAAAERGSTGRRARTGYEITAAGRQALRDWLASPSAGTQLESEAALKLFFADQSGLAEAAASVRAVRADARAALEQLAAMAAGEPRFPERTPTNVLSMRLVAEVHAALYRWSEWAADAVAVLEGGDAQAIEEQTRQALAVIAAGPSDSASAADAGR